MEEKILAKGTMRKTNILSIIFLILGGYYLIAGAVFSFVYDDSTDFAIGLVGGAIGFGFSKLFQYIFNSYEITVTDKRVYGKAAFGKRVDLPIDSISAIGSRSLKGITVATSSGRIAFLMIKNRDEIHKCVSDLLIERQNKATVTPTTTIKQEIPQSNAEELKKYKELLDMGAITQEEYDAKKKQLLGL